MCTHACLLASPFFDAAGTDGAHAAGTGGAHAAGTDGADAAGTDGADAAGTGGADAAGTDSADAARAVLIPAGNGGGRRLPRRTEDAAATSRNFVIFSSRLLAYALAWACICV